MKILAIETSCDDTAISIIEAKGGLRRPAFKVLAHNISSQIKIHQEWGGVVPSLAKREHGKNLMPLLIKSLGEAFGKPKTSRHPPKNHELKTVSLIEKILEREPELKEQFLKIIPSLTIPKIDAIAVTEGPGLEPALWVGINFAKALSFNWDKPIIPINHLEGHLYASIFKNNQKLQFPALALIVSGGHTELILVKNWLKYKLIGQTRDDAAGEAFDKVARILGLSYPGGPEIAKLAKQGERNEKYQLPRPMINSDNFDFSFSGLKTAVLYLVQKIEKIDDKIKSSIAKEFEQAVIDVLLAKTIKAIGKFKPKTLIIGGGVIANIELRRQFQEKIDQNYPKIKLLIPDLQFTTDNATMIAIAAYLRLIGKKLIPTKNIHAQGHLPLK